MDEKVNLKLANVEFGKSRFQSYFGNMGEVIAQEVLSREGFEVCRWNPLGGEALKPKVHNSLGRCLRCLYPIKDETVTIDGITFHSESFMEENPEKIIKELNIFFGDKLNNLKKYIDTLGIFPVSIGACYIPDLVAKKNDEIYIVEVKTNSGNIYKDRTKLRGLLSARKFDLIPLLVHFNLSLKAMDFTVKELE